MPSSQFDQVRFLRKQVEALTRDVQGLVQHVKTLSSPVERIAPITLTASQCADLLQIGSSTWHSKVAGKEAPPPKRMGHTSRWDRAEVEAWFRAGCPVLQKWRRMQDEERAMLAPRR